VSPNDLIRKIPLQAILLIGLIITGIILQRLGVFDWHQLLKIAESYAHLWWFPFIIILAKIILYTFGLPGSVLCWIAGVLYHPLEATLIIVIGGVAGGVTAFTFSQRMFPEVMCKIKTSRFFSFMQRHSDFTTLCAIRTLPTFPHSVINFGSGMIHVPPHRFIISTVIGFSVKGYLYASSIRNTATADEIADLLSVETTLPLIIIVLLFIVAKIFQRKYLH
jgi:uncharacterized membrane protein YdjX (TVP38/TMEM64 family)